MTTATDGAGILADILADPGDDTPRLVYADWLEDEGQAERAEFIRVQMRMAREMPPLHRPRCNCQGCQLKGRAHTLWPGVFDMGALSFLGDSYEATIDPASEQQCRVRLFVRRGFVESVRCPFAAWLDHGEAVCAAHPVTRVGATDRRPTRLPGGPAAPGWYCWPAYDPTQPHVLGSEIWGLLRGGWSSIWHRYWRFYDDDAAALDALSDALIKWANLPPERRGTP
jgi:uncharacterized protein (TIGR02996 family)